MIFFGTLVRYFLILVLFLASSIANFCEADDAESKKDFKHKIGICKKEARKSKHFAKMLKVAVPEYENELGLLLKEVGELNLIFNSIYHKLK